MSQQQARTFGPCAYCGRHDVLTVEHVIPRGLFNYRFNDVKGGVPGDVPRLGVCHACNNEKSADDTFLRDVLVRDARVAEHPIAQDIRHGAHECSLMRGKSQYPRAASRLRYVPSPTGSGLMTVEPILPKERLRTIFTQLTRGLMLAYERYTLPATTNVDVMRAVDVRSALDEAQRWALDTSGLVHSVQAGDGRVFWCVYYHPQTPDRLNESIWWLRFYEKTLYMVFSGMSDLALGEF